MAEVAAVDVASGDMQVCDGGGDRPRHARADDQGDKFDDREEDRDPQQDVGDSANEFSKGSEQMAVENRRTSCDLENGAVLVGSSLIPIDHRKWCAESDFAVEAGGGFGYGSDGESGMQG